ncbi:histidinol phosphatase : DNA polymerase IV (Family X) OS=Singulisphaera acidiphila (strain ATCC BAA-1392 / DSM 18658 / VKM B-2454 / MOB10) GN=Sinac_2234 PE=4 SV=1: HHH_8: DNA_pol_B_thumb: PHP [Gemmataceae bacterium]|nr:histidinol phosphatase : DNA polymerase IV (Family X) OS=Singulisphaera acidiphila (strain ATCC BAA-1392 / DSM 18658 / VKM B-2454 / MOB10) GN=Sinac_2234 PE=4 SV=1: HHH_8: DNA_pol_B_thumb: PHP [Gemmataceae bacterium]VTU00576.1 histidinol phosphatase : DNA polymerase IV (Family X) OS=Singulisphaera acidiphila (strain ATCC BAA-1392 / DSM 18658 / VKM B-2454 / MOB10) GN=Sinac_2234 PE=4 SV=1: HHH_8: DNA_pol_B_thumb: PHP [Gemmataceae bacterium]
MTKDEVAAALDEMGTLLALKGENAFRCNAYHNAARTVSQLEGDLKQLVAAGKLSEVRGIGDTLQEKITTLVKTGRHKFLDELRASVPEGLVTMLRLPGMGPKKVKALHDVLGIDTIAKLKAACESGEVAAQKGFGAKTQQKILEGIAFLGTVGNRVRIDYALPLGLALLEKIKKMPGVDRAELCGSLRRRRETAKDIDILVSSTNPQPIMDAFVKLPEVVQIVGHGPTKSSVVAAMHLDGTKVTLNADLRVVEATQFPFALVYFTGSKEHNIRLRQRALDRGWTLNEYALGSDAHQVKAKTEADVYAALGLEYVPPEMREDTGEIEVAEAKKIPVLVEDADILGVFHNHTTYSDGTASLEEMALAAKALGWEYFGVADHSQSLTVARGLPPGVVRKQWAEIDRVNAKLSGVTIIKGTEVDILADGSLDYDDELLAGFDYVVASVHSLFNMTEEEMTARVCKALAHPAVTMLGHSTGRLLLKRDGYKIDLEAVLQCAARHGKMVEINAQPSRLDLDRVHVKRAKALGVPIVINPDAHSPGELGLTTFGVDVARRGWLTSADVFNTRSLKDVMKELKRRKGR